MSITTIIMIIAIIWFVIIPGFKTRTFPVTKLIIMPAVFMYMNYESLTTHFHIRVADYVIIAAGLIAGSLIGALLRKNTPIKADRNKKLVELQGSYFGLVMFLLIFAVHFVIGYVESTSPTYLLHPSSYEQALIFLLTCVSSMSIGANAVLFYKYRTGQSIELVETK